MSYINNLINKSVIDLQIYQKKRKFVISYNNIFPPTLADRSKKISAKTH